MHGAPHIVLVGPMGAGKSAIGQRLAVRMGLPFVDLDACVEADAGQPIAAIFDRLGEGAFRALETRALLQALAAARSVIATGGGAVLAPANREAMQRDARVVYLQVSPSSQLQRVAGDPARPLLRGADPAQRLAALQAQREPLYRALADLAFDTSAYAPDGAAEALHAALQHGVAA